MAATLALLSLVPGMAAAVDLPSSFDLRDVDGRSYIGAVRNQGQCGSCYSFSTLAAAESTLNRFHQLADGRALDLSESFIVWNLSPYYDNMAGCNGGNLEDPMTAMIEYGVPLERYFPYPIEKDGRTVREPSNVRAWNAPRYRLADWYAIPINDVETTRRVLHSVGAVAIAVYAGRDDWFHYTGGVLEDAYSIPTLEDYAKLDHAIALVGYDDEPEQDGLGHWIARNSWDGDWGDNGYLRLRYTHSLANTYGLYFSAAPWSGENLHIENNGAIEAASWRAGGTLNAHGLDLWGAHAASVFNGGDIRADLSSLEELTTSRGIYLWGGPGGRIENRGDILASAFSRNGQAFAYGLSFQGGRIINQGRIDSWADTDSGFALAYGIWAGNGGSLLEIENSGEIFARTGSGNLKGAAGIWSDSHGPTRVVNSGRIAAVSGDGAAGVFFNRGPGWLENRGIIEAQISSENPLLEFQGGAGVAGYYEMTIVNSGTISGSTHSIFGTENTLLVLESGSDLIGPVVLDGEDDRLVLTGSGREDETFQGVETLSMEGGNWSLGGASAFAEIHLEGGRLAVDNGVVLAKGNLLAGDGVVAADVVNSGSVAPGRSIGQLTIEGDFRQQESGVLLLETDGEEMDRLRVTGAATLDGTLRIEPRGEIKEGNWRILETAAVSGGFAKMQTVAVLAATLESGAAGVDLRLARNSYGSLASSHNRGLAYRLDGLRAAAADDFGLLCNQIDYAWSGAELNDHLAQLTPRIHGLASALLLDEGQVHLDSLRRRMKGPEAAPSRTSLWLETPGRFARYGSDKGYFGARRNLYGLTLGLERGPGNGWTFGLAGNLSKSRYEAINHPDDGATETLQGFLYGFWRDPEKPAGWRLGGALGGGFAEFEADRAIPFADRKSAGDHDGRLFGATLEGGYDWRRGKWLAGAFFGASWFHLDEEGFRESGADSADLRLSSRRNDSLLGFVGGRISHSHQWGRLLLNPQMSLQWLHEFDDDGTKIKATLAEGGGSFVTPGREAAIDSLLVGAALKMQLSPALFADLGYDCTVRDNNDAAEHALHLQLGWRF